MEKVVFDPEQFEKTITLLKQYGGEQSTRDHKQNLRKTQAYFDYGPDVSAFVPDLDRVTHSLDIGKTFIALLSTIPGVDTNGMSVEASRRDNISISDQAIAINVRNGSVVTERAYLTFPSAFPIPDGEYFTLEFDKNDGTTYVSLEIRMDSGCYPRKGEISIGGADGNFRTPRGSARFGQDSKVTKGSNDMGLAEGEELNLVNLIAELTSPENLESPINPTSIIQKAKQPALPTGT